jgi:pyruvate/oxaloacetate carboxyltransferase
MTLAITDVVLRDAHQSLFATRLRLDDMLPICAARRRWLRVAGMLGRRHL